MKKRWCGSMAEQLIRNEQVDGSIPFTSSKKIRTRNVRIFSVCGQLSAEINQKNIDKYYIKYGFLRRRSKRTNT